MPFKKGESGNPGGRPKEDAEIKELARQHGSAAIEKLAEHLNGEDAKLAQAAAIALLDRGFGKPHQTSTVDGDLGITVIEFQKNFDNNDDL